MTTSLTMAIAMEVANHTWTMMLLPPSLQMLKTMSPDKRS